MLACYEYQQTTTEKNNKVNRFLIFYLFCQISEGALEPAKYGLPPRRLYTILDFVRFFYLEFCASMHSDQLAVET